MRSSDHSGRGRIVDFELNSSEVGDVLVIAMLGQGTAGNVRQIVGRCYELMSESDKQKVLVDIRDIKGRVPLPSVYHLFRNLPAQPPRKAKVAILDLDQSRNWAEFMETTATNAGVPFRSLYDFDEAMSWLNG
jgi:hypothetical protein